MGATREEAEGALREKAPEIARLLGFDLVSSGGENRHLAKLRAPEGYVIYINAGYQAGYDRFSISGERVRDDDNHEVYLGHGVEYPRIQVAIGRPARAIAMEIQRRLLPDYTDLWRQANEKLASHRAYERSKADAAAELADICGVPRGEVRDGEFSLYRSTRFPENLGSVSVSGDEVKLDLRLPLEDAKALLASLEDRR